MYRNVIKGSQMRSYSFYHLYNFTIFHLKITKPKINSSFPEMNDVYNNSFLLE